MVLVDPLISLGLVSGQSGQTCIGSEDISQVGDPCRIFANCRVRDLEAFFDRMKGNPDTYGVIVLRQYLLTQKAGHQGGDPLLTVDQDPLAG